MKWVALIAFVAAIAVGNPCWAKDIENKTHTESNKQDIEDKKSDNGSKKLVLTIGVYDEHLESFKRAFASGQCPSVLEYPLEDSQPLTEFIILCEALSLGGIEPQFEFKNAPEYKRLLNSTGASFIVMPGFSIWKKDINKDLFYVSTPLLDVGEFSKGIYTVAANKNLLKVKNLSELRRYVVVSNSNWIHDKNEIDCMNLKFINAQTPINMAHMIMARRADFTLFPFFLSEDLSGFVADIRLVPVPGMKVAISDSLHFVVSKHHPQGQEVYRALQKGLSILTDNGTIHKAYLRLGFFNPDIKSWTTLGCEKGAL